MSKILIIEDNSVLCRMLCNWLERKGLQTEHTDSAVQARKLIATTNADVSSRISGYPMVTAWKIYWSG